MASRLNLQVFNIISLISFFVCNVKRFHFSPFTKTTVVNDSFENQLFALRPAQIYHDNVPTCPTTAQNSELSKLSAVKLSTAESSKENCDEDLQNQFMLSNDMCSTWVYIAPFFKFAKSNSNRPFYSLNFPLFGRCIFSMFINDVIALGWFYFRPPLY